MNDLQRVEVGVIFCQWFPHSHYPSVTANREVFHSLAYTHNRKREARLWLPECVHTTSLISWNSVNRKYKW